MRRKIEIEGRSFATRLHKPTYLIGTSLWSELTHHPWSSLVERGEGSYLPNCKTNLVIALYTLPLLFCKLLNTTAYHLGRYEPSSLLSSRIICHLICLMILIYPFQSLTIFLCQSNYLSIALYKNYESK